MLKDTEIIITSNINKTNLLKKLNNNLHSKKIYSINEFNKLYYFDYDEKAIYYIMDKYKVIYEIAIIYLNNLYYINNINYKSSKLQFLSSLKKELISKNLLKINSLFKSTIINKKITFYNLSLTKEMEILIKELKLNNKVEIINDKTSDQSHLIIELPTINDEVEYIANSICNLIKDGIDISHIFLTNLSEDYRKIIKRIFPMFNIPYTLESNETLYTTYICTKFMELYEDNLEITLTKLKEYVTSPSSEEIYNKIVDIINKYIFIKDNSKVKEMIKYDLKHTKLSKENILSSVHEVNLKDTIFTDDDYVFTVSFNQGIIPVIYKDEEYLTDIDKAELNISLTVDKNNQERIEIINKIKSIKNLTITYKKNAEGEEFTISSINEILNYKIEKITENFLNNSNTYNKIKLASLLDEYYKYGTKSNLLFTLNNHYQNIQYKTYDNKFNGIKRDDFIEYINNKLTLSYSSLDKFYRCPFSFYISNILKLNIYEETFFQIIGTLFHNILEKFLNTKLTYDELWQQEVNNLNHEFTIKEIFFLNKLKEELKFIIETIKEQENFTNLHDELHEERIYKNIEGNIKITFTGIIDKIKYKKGNNNTIVAIIDYKTGNPNLDLTTLPYGIGMQLPVYLYLAKNSPKLENVKIAGFYLQKVLNNEIVVDKSHTYEQLKKKNLLLQGYSNNNQSILSEFDNSYLDSNIIKSMKVKNDNSFYSYSKVLSEKEMDKITNIVENKIKEATMQIENAIFPISPKKIEKINYGCTLCKFKDICFHTAADIEELKKLEIEDVLGGKE